MTDSDSPRQQLREEGAPTISVHWWAKDDETGRAAAGGFLRCDSATEYIEFARQCQERTIAVRVVVP